MLNLKNLKSLIAKNGFTLLELSEASGVGLSTLNRILHGKKAQLATIGRLANALGCEPSYLLTDKE